MSEFDAVKDGIVRMIKSSAASGRYSQTYRAEEMLRSMGSVRPEKPSHPKLYRVSIMIETLHFLGVDSTRFIASTDGRMDRDRTRVYIEDKPGGSSLIIGLAAAI